MPRYYCDYCDTYLTHDSPSVRKQHNAGYKHKANVRTYYQQFEEQQTQSLIDQKIKEHLSGQVAYGQIGATYAAWRPGMRPPILPAPLPIPGSVPPNAPMGMMPRLPVLPRPAGFPVYGTAPVMVPSAGQPGTPTAPMQANGLPGPPSMSTTTSLPGPPPMTAPTSVPGVAAPGSNGALPTASQPVFHGLLTSGGFSGSGTPAAPSFPQTTSGADSNL